jgi:hypothetical protein
MDITSIRNKMIADIKKAPGKDLKEMYRLHSLVKEEKKFTLSWDSLSEKQKKHIEEGIEQLDAGKGIPVENTIAFLNKKYGINS